MLVNNLVLNNNSFFWTVFEHFQAASTFKIKLFLIKKNIDSSIILTQ